VSIGPGIYEISAAEYHADALRPEPTLSRSGIHAILTGTMADYAAANPRLTKWPESLGHDSTDSTDLGDIIHATVLGGNGGAKFIVGEPSDFMTKKGEPYSSWSGAAKEWKDQQRASGLIVVNHAVNAKAVRIGTLLTAAIEARFGKRAWAERKAEQTLIWERRLNDGSAIWCRARPDAILPDDGTIIDPKTTALGLSDAEIGKMIAVGGLDIQSEWYRDGAVETGDEFADERPARPPFIFAFIRSVPPFSIRFVDLEKEGWDLKLTRMRIDLAAHKFGGCLRTGEWPDHPIDAHPVQPSWHVNMCERQVGLDGEIEAES
jgi:hypothetical protein